MWPKVELWIVFDYVVVGAGSAGAAVAARLSESGRHRVLLLEAGPSDWRFWIQLPIGYGKTFYDRRVNWMYQSEPVPGLSGRNNYFPRGKVLGGSSSINAMVYSRGQAGDFDDWEAEGNPGWGWKDILPVYKHMEDHALGAGPFHGAGGPLHVSEISGAAHPLTHEFIKAGQEAGIPFTPDLNGASIEGVGFYQINTRSGLRLSAARAYLWPAESRPNLRIETGALATRILFEGKRAVGIAYEQRGQSCEARAAAEVILCGGSINSPQLLQLSGVGPAALLKSCGIEVLHESPAVGQNLQDHLCHDYVYRCRVPSLNDQLNNWPGRLRAGLHYLLTRGGPLALSVNQGGGFFRTSADLARPNMQLYFCPLTYEKVPPGTRALLKPDPFSGLTLSASPCRPTSRGEIRIKSADPREAPLIHAELSLDQSRRGGAPRRRPLPAAPGRRAVARGGHRAGAEAGTGDGERGGARGGYPRPQLFRVPSRRHLPHGTRSGRGRGGSSPEGAWARGSPGDRCLDLPHRHLRQHQCTAIMVGEKGAALVLEDAG